jgi:hypothetical protein
MSDYLLLGASRSGVHAVGSAVAQAVGLPVTDCAAGLGLIYHLAAAAAAYAAALRPKRELPARFTDSALAALAQEILGPPAELELRLLSAADTLSHTPNLRAAHDLLALRPDLRAIIIWRPGVDFINSRLRAMPEADFASHCLCWANAIAEMGRLCAAFPDRVLPLEHATLVQDPAAIASSLGKFLDLPLQAAQAMMLFFETNQPRRTAAQLQNPVLDAAASGWSMPEVELFHLLCGTACAATGQPLNLEKAERLRPLDLVQEALRYGRVSQGIELRPAQERHGMPSLFSAGPQGAGAGLWLSPVSAGGRRHLSIRANIEEAGPGAAFGCDIIESLSRRVLLTTTLPLAAQGVVAIDEVLPSHNGFIDVMLTPAAGAANARLQLTEAALSYV